MDHHNQAFVGIDTSKLRNAIAVAEDGRGGPVRYLGEIDATAAATRKLVAKLAAKYSQLTFCYEAGPTGYGLYRLIRSLGHDCMVVAPSLSVAGLVRVPMVADLARGCSDRSASRIRTWTEQLQRLSCCRYTKAEFSAGPVNGRPRQFCQMLPGFRVAGWPVPVEVHPSPMLASQMQDAV